MDPIYYAYGSSYLWPTDDATTFDKTPVPDVTSRCLNCGVPGTDHVGGKCLFEPTEFAASRKHLPYVYPRYAPSASITSTLRWIR